MMRLFRHLWVWCRHHIRLWIMVRVIALGLFPMFVFFAGILYLDKYRQLLIRSETCSTRKTGSNVGLCFITC